MPEPRSSGGSYVLRKLWLPTGISVPFGEFNAWRQWIIYASAWLSVCAVWVGCTRHRSLRILLKVVAGNAAALVILMAAQRVAGNGTIPWPLTSLTTHPLTASFIYENHAGGYFALAAFSAIALATWFFFHSERTLAKSSPSTVFGFLAIVLAVAVLFTLSRGASLALGLALFVFTVWGLLRLRASPSGSVRLSPATKVFLVVFLVFGVITVHYLDFAEVYSRFEEFAVQKENEPSIYSRVLAHQAAAEMLKDHWVRGVGAGCFRHLYPEYVKHYPEIYEGGHIFWAHAHCDWLEIPIELGLFGDLLLAGGAAWWVWLFAKKGVIWSPFVVPVLLGCLQTLVHATFDFPLQCPAILVTWCVLIAVAGSWVEIGGGE